MKTYTQSELRSILDLHEKWLEGRVDGVKADLSNADLRGAYFSYSYFDGGADLRYVNFSYSYLSGASLVGANLKGAYFRWATLNGADITGVNLWGTIGNNKEIKSLQIFEEYPVCYTKDRLQIGCKNYSFDEWKSFSDDEIDQMDPDKALCFWVKYKSLIFSIIEQSPAL